MRHEMLSRLEYRRIPIAYPHIFKGHRAGPRTCFALSPPSTASSPPRRGWKPRFEHLSDSPLSNERESKKEKIVKLNHFQIFRILRRMKRLLPLIAVRGHRKKQTGHSIVAKRRSRDKKGRKGIISVRCESEHFSLFLFSLLSFGGRHLITVKGVHVDSKGRFLRGAVTDFMHSCADAAGGFLKTESDTGRGGRRGREKTGGEARRQLSYTLSRDTAPYEREKTRGGTVRDKKERIKAEFFFLFIFIYSFFLSFLSPEDVRNEVDRGKCTCVTATRPVDRSDR